MLSQIQWQLYRLTDVAAVASIRFIRPTKHTDGANGRRVRDGTTSEQVRVSSIYRIVGLSKELRVRKDMADSDQKLEAGIEEVKGKQNSMCQ